ncbi:gas vesicle protein [Streptomyces ureilyticus]|uniref:Gas vesicle protein n=1 Tax=Streptomyces ureilyticus TaxID=1775131 RepID=A0ABX0DTF8_9ACTN|nr:gas vesicle protein [Streptomyces ureilyticus]NGO45190.1 gas vesicle protein [Streptomyces ureilyticus]
MTQPVAGTLGGSPSRRPSPYDQGPGGQGANLADILERVLDKGVVIAGDIRINLLDIELLTIKLRLVVASVDKAKEMGIDWWEHDPSLSSRASRASRASSSAAEWPVAERPDGVLAERRDGSLAERPDGRSLAEAEDPVRSLAEENERLRAEIAALRSADRSPAS